MYQARLTESGATRWGRPELADEIVNYEGIHELGLCVINVTHNDQHFAPLMSFTGDDRSVDLITKPEDNNGL